MGVNTVFMAALMAGVCALPLAAQDGFREPESRVDVGDWSLECYLRSDGTPEACQAYYRVLMDNATRIALVASFAVPAEGEGILYQISLPLGIDLMAGVLMTVDGGYAVNLPVTRCTLQGCLLEGRLTAAPLNALLTGTGATFAVQSREQGILPIPMSLVGLGVAIDRIKAATRPIPEPTAPLVPAADPDPALTATQLDLALPLSDATDTTLAPVTGVTDATRD